MLNVDVQTFLTKVHGDENIKFWLACNAYRNATGDRKQLARLTYDQFIGELARTEINITADVKFNIDSRLKEAPPWFRGSHVFAHRPP